MSKIRAVVVDPDAPNRLVLADVEEPSATPSEALAAVSLNRGYTGKAVLRVCKQGDSRTAPACKPL